MDLLPFVVDVYSTTPYLPTSYLGRFRSLAPDHLTSGAMPTCCTVACATVRPSHGGDPDICLCSRHRGGRGESARNRPPSTQPHSTRIHSQELTPDHTPVPLTDRAMGMALASAYAVFGLPPANTYATYGAPAIAPLSDLLSAGSSSLYTDRAGGVSPYG